MMTADYRITGRTSAVLCMLCSVLSVAADEPVFPGVDWRVERPEDHGLDGAKLEQAEAVFEAQDERYGFLVVKDGVIVHEAYFSGDKDTRHPAYSVTKSFASAVVGIAQTQGYLHVKDKVSDWLPIHHAEVAAGATIENVISMTAGSEPPGTAFRYTSGNILNTLPNVLWVATGVPPYEYYLRELAAPIGLTIDWPHTDKGWMQIGTQGVAGLTVMKATHRDLARLGWLWLNNGNWNGQQLIAEDYIRASITPPFPAANPTYGYLWWLTREDGMADDQPSAVYRAIGANDQLIIVIPAHNVVVASMGNTRDRSADVRQKLDAAIALFLN